MNRGIFKTCLLLVGLFILISPLAMGKGWDYLAKNWHYIGEDRFEQIFYDDGIRAMRFYVDRKSFKTDDKGYRHYMLIQVDEYGDGLFNDVISDCSAGKRQLVREGLNWGFWPEKGAESEEIEWERYNKKWWDIKDIGRFERLAHDYVCGDKK